MIEDIIKNLETLRTLLAREAALARAMAELEVDANFGVSVSEFAASASADQMSTNQPAASIARPTAEQVTIDKDLSWTGIISHAASSSDYVFNGRHLTTTEMEFVASVSPVML